MLGEQRGRRGASRRRGRGAPAPAASAPPGPVPASIGSPGSVLPYDYGARFALRGIPGNTIEDVINITPEGAFVATAIGYSFEEDRGRELKLHKPDDSPPDLKVPFRPGDIRLKNIPPQALIEGFRFAPAFVPAVFEIQAGSDPSRPASERFLDHLLPPEFADRILQAVRPPTEISFYFSIVDSGTGRELQDIPAHSLASLGKSNGERPFRLLAKPVAFLPRTTVRVQVVEATEGAVGTLYVVLFGYKVLGTSGCPEPVIRSLVEQAMRSPGVPPVPSARVIPFDYVSTLRLTGLRGNLVEDVVPVNVDGAYVATALGYAMLVEGADVALNRPAIAALLTELKKQNPPAGLQGLTDLFAPETDPLKEGWAVSAIIKEFSELPLRVFPPGALRDGMRIRPGFIRFAYKNDGKLNDQVSVAIANRMFERLNRPEDVSFLYTIFDAGTGRELQNMYLHNLGGLGIANGDRPFKQFAKPMLFQARSTIRTQVVEGFGRGTLYLVFQGYKVLSAPPAGGS